ncbi:MAG: response regulator [Myxococcales bacterium]|nr:response regulator [Myxococcales bacterium]
MTTTTRPVILGIDEDRANQGRLAQAFNAQGLFYRFITDRKKVQGGIKQLTPDILVVFGELSSDFVIQVLDAVAADVSSSTLPIIVVSGDVSDAQFVGGLRTNVVALFPAPFEAASVIAVKGLFDELHSRPGVVKGQGDAKLLARLIDHIRRTRRAGALTIDPKTPNEGRAVFSRGKLERASFLGAVGPEALKAISLVPKCAWTFSEVAGQAGDGAGVVIEVGDLVSGETEVAEVVIGQVVLEDEPLAFEVSVPRASTTEAPPPPPPNLTPEPMLAPGAQAIQLLLVDDDEAILRMFKTLFLKHGFKVSTATDGQLGSEVALTKHFDVVLADLNMPHLDGWGLLRLLREDFRTRELPVAFISAHDDYRESLRALDAGAQAYLSKGTRLDALVTQVKKLLEPRQAALGQITSGSPFSMQVAPLGPQWLLLRLEESHASGRLDARDGWAVYSLFFTDGACTHAAAQAGKFTAEGERAFNAFIATKNAEVTWTPGNGAAPQNLHLPTAVSIERACATLNENERRMRESLLVSATQVEVHPELYAVYRQVGPKQWLEAAKLICEDKMAPRDIIAKLEISPVDVEETMKDLIRRGVVMLKKG